ncbi:MAG TPA: dephospho-CoA kinase [Vicinamibacterales bacterium]|nr:dephospho-CoA kinase [Vicinamibacterales bacterium]
MLRVGLTGGIATGKSFCLKRFARLGVPVIDADRIAREVVAPGSAALESIRARFGSSIIAADGNLNRGALAGIVFTDRAARADLESIIHPEVYRRINDWFANQRPGTRFAIADIPLLFETGHEHDFDSVIVCACEPFEQLRRLMERDGLSEDDARARLAAQWPIAEKIARADHVIRTDGTYEATDTLVHDVFDALTSEA